MAKTILITGSTDGIGLEAAKMLAGEGHQLLLHGRSAQKLTAAEHALEGSARSYRADLSSLKETAALAADIRSNHEQIDVLINNAGVFKTSDPILPSGQDVRFVVNTVAPYMLTKALLPIVPHSGRVINLSSAAQSPVDPSAMEGNRTLGDMDAYSQSKRAITLWTHRIAQTLPRGPAVIAVNPGSLLASKMVREGFGVAGNDIRIGATILRRLSLDDEFAAHSGAYWDNDIGAFAQIDTSQAEDVTAAVDALSRSVA
ncbi:MAG: SDR family NAD(P)-dependent oxidoreductase [Pseudomonadota bacterium]